MNIKDLGFIKIDGQDISNLGLNHVRRSVAVIPQISFIFKGTLRYNIDPMKQVLNKDIVSTLEDFEVYDLLIPEEHKNTASNEKVTFLYFRIFLN